MARYERLPIYKNCLDLTVYFEKTVAWLAFPVTTTYTLGTELQMISREVKSLGSSSSAGPGPVDPGARSPASVPRRLPARSHS